MHRTTFALAAFVVAFLATGDCAANPTYSSGYPKPGSATGKIAVKRTLTLAANVETTGTAVIVTWPTGGGALKSHTMTIAAGQTGTINWGEDQTDNSLTTNAPYNVVVQYLFTARITFRPREPPKLLTALGERDRGRRPPRKRSGSPTRSADVAGTSRPPTRCSPGT